MQYVSFVELFGVSAVQAFQQAGFVPDTAMRYATFSFFVGCLITWLLDKFVDWMVELPGSLEARRQRKAERPKAAGVEKQVRAAV